MTLMTFSQRDPRWGGEILGEGPVTIGRAGCLLTAAAAMLAAWGVDTDPHRLNRWLLANNGFADGDLLRFAALGSLGAQVVDYINCADIPAPVETLAEELKRGAGVLVCLDSTPGAAFQPHWVQLLSLADASGQIVDPWQLPGHELGDIRSYLAPGWDAARGIFQVAIYGRSQMRGVGGPRDIVQPGLCYREELASQ